jgi:peptidoglycan/LPS O-acetylase OafA/YrhL
MTAPAAATPAGHPRPPRLHGLDTLRALAIALVVGYHYQIFVSGRSTFGPVGDLGWAGVDLFFVLSGYLIGQQILAPLCAGEPFALARFYQRRLLRTLPDYLVVLACYLALPALMGGVPRTPLWRFLTFTQNFGLLPGSAFSQAWSLCVEEQFYLLLPAALLLCAACGRLRHAGWALLAAWVVAGTAARAWLWQRYGHAPVPYMVHIYYASVARFDEFVPGVALALLRQGHPALWQRVTRHGRAWFMAGVALTAAVLWAFLRHDEAADGSRAAFTTIAGYPLLALGFGLLVLSALCPGAPLQRWRVPGARALALQSYALYLVHKPVFALLKPLLLRAGLAPQQPLALALLLGASIAAAALLYRVVEQPVMRWRDRRVPARRAPLQPATALR